MIAIAHRGDWSSAPENTLAAFEAAEQAGADMIELDVRLTADGAVAVVHDPTLERIWGVARPVAQVMREELRELGGKHRIPELADVLEAISIPVMVDYTDADFVEATVAVIESAGALDRVLFSGGNLEGHRRIRERAAGARIALTWEGTQPPPALLLEELRVEYFNPCHDIVSEQLVAAMHDRGVLVSTWTVDTIGEMGRVLDAGVDAIISNRTAELVRVLAERRSEEARC
jgi:glycerophosphoryl diester phosphodiesterase